MGVGLIVVIVIIGLVSFYANWEMKRSIQGLDDDKKLAEKKKDDSDPD